MKRKTPSLVKLNAHVLILIASLRLMTVHAATVRWAGSSNRIYVESGGSATLTDIKAALNNLHPPPPVLDLVDAGGKVWLLKANLVIADGSTLLLRGASAGGDVNELRLLSNNSLDAGSFVSVTADYGTIDIRATKVTSWNMALGAPDIRGEVGTPIVTPRAFLRARSSMAPDGVTPRESRMDVTDSEISYLGYDNAESYGLAWKVNGVERIRLSTISSGCMEMSLIHTSITIISESTPSARRHRSS